MTTALVQQQIFSLLQAAVSPATLLREAEPMSRHTTLRVGGPADLYAEPGGEEDLASLLRICSQQGISFVVIGRGSNLLVRDGGIRGLVLSLTQPAFTGIVTEDNILRVGAGARLKEVAVQARRAGLAGLEFLEGIPGNVGGALRMNAGAMGRCMFDVTRRIRCMDHTGHITEVDSSELPVHYRACPHFQDHLALAADLVGTPSTSDLVGQRMKSFSRQRWDTQPAAPSAGCMFKNPPGIPAGRLVQELGLKGTRIGGAMVSDVHANFIVNQDQATARDVLSLLDLIRETARRERGIELETEVQILGEDPA